MPTLTLPSGDTLFYTQSAPLGDRPPLVLIHGAGGDHLHWPPALRHDKGWPVLALDLPGHGQSTGAPPTAIAEHGAWLQQWAAALGISSAVWVGHSMGGAIALWLALNAPDRVAGLGLVSSAARLKVGTVLLDLLNQPGQSARLTDLVTANSYAPHTPASILQRARQQLANVPQPTLRADFVACNAFDTREHVSAWHGPTLLLVGELDQMTPPRFSAWLAEQWPQATLVQLPQAGHMLPIERPAEVTEHIRAFLQANFAG